MLAVISFVLFIFKPVLLVALEQERSVMGDCALYAKAMPYLIPLISWKHNSIAINIVYYKNLGLERHKATKRRLYIMLTYLL